MIFKQNQHASTSAYRDIDKDIESTNNILGGNTSQPHKRSGPNYNSINTTQNETVVTVSKPQNIPGGLVIHANAEGTKDMYFGALLGSKLAVIYSILHDTGESEIYLSRLISQFDEIFNNSMKVGEDHMLILERILRKAALGELDPLDKVDELSPTWKVSIGTNSVDYPSNPGIADKYHTYVGTDGAYRSSTIDPSMFYISDPIIPINKS
jgi:hypothetical protein